MDKTLFRKLAGIVPTTQKLLSEEKVDLSIEDILQYLDQSFHGERGFEGSRFIGCSYGPGVSAPMTGWPQDGEGKEPRPYDVVMSCLDALEKKGFDKAHLKTLRDYFGKRLAVDEAYQPAARAIGKVHQERWDRADEARSTKLPNS